ncbi:PAPA-1 domain-containing protein [Mycena venus]|uniref:PAPA-1 domain-containing protein n=1 Tax=Mycena venus TaxID=2733690 RepID=A0A8H6YV28_9AGAR|nr:PAPA-1 domain-containing protein [Mycena venus]
MQISNDDEPHPTSSSDPADMDIDEEPQSEEEQVEVDVLPDAASESEASEAAEGEAEVEEPEEYELEDEDDEIQESRSPSVAAPAAKSPPENKIQTTAVQVQSEDSEESTEEEMPQNVRLTKRQAALAKARKGVASSETSADEDQEQEEPAPNKKKRGAALDPSEVALRKEESARKRRNVSEKKLQNEKVPSAFSPRPLTASSKSNPAPRARNKRTTALSEVPTPVAPSEGERAGSVDVPVGDGIEEQAEKDGDAAAAQALPTMYRWISTTRADLNPTSTSSSADDDNEKAAKAVMTISLSLPASVALAIQPLDAEMPPAAPEKPLARVPAVCGVAGCGKDRRYRLVGGEWGAGACGMVHLKILEGR